MNVVFSVAFPLFALIATGFVAGRVRLLGRDGSGALNVFVTWFALPALLFNAIASVRLSEVLNLPFIAAFGLTIVIVYGVGMLMARLASGAGLAQMSLHGLTAAYGNVGYIGIPLCLYALGPQGAVPAAAATCLGSAFLLTFAVVLIESDLQAGRGLWRTTRRVLVAVARSPVLIAIVAGGIVSALGIKLPVPIQRFLELIGAAAAPCALFAIGLFLSHTSIRANLREVGLATISKVLLQPLVALSIVPWFLPLDSVWAQAALLMATLPTASNAFVLAKQYDVFVEETSTTVLLSTLLSVFTVSAMLVWLRGGF
ncbi:MAG: AEC family transporter [Alphaproteobacteria bacterium]|nr:AEC family transporter [Alphaproteobacteria bacterium]